MMISENCRVELRQVTDGATLQLQYRTSYVCSAWGKVEPWSEWKLVPLVCDPLQMIMIENQVKNVGSESKPEQEM